MNQFTSVATFISGFLFSVLAYSASDCHGLKGELDQLKNAQTQLLKSMIEDQKLAAEALSNFGTMVHMAPSKELVAQMDATSVGFQKRAEASQRTLERLESLTQKTLEQTKACLK